MKHIFVLVAVALTLVLTGCETVRTRTDNAQLETGLRFDEDGRVTDDPKVTIPLFDSNGLKQKPRDVAPPRK